MRVRVRACVYGQNDGDAGRRRLVGSPSKKSLEEPATRSGRGEMVVGLWEGVARLCQVARFACMRGGVG